MEKGLSAAFGNKFGRLDELGKQELEVGEVLQSIDREWNLFHIVTEKHFDQQATYHDAWEPLEQLRDMMLSQDLM
ncbi:unnamed protein product [Ceutorhynchus assimilis]|uniref:Uncharacterized protein n=1 Tax=Ceutorhynchus assimilis TaxID=467358 RepID=A0A9N9QRY4_9CUCU|nr:unnamed protein product [Ceutorhynchus assimilis]